MQFLLESVRLSLTPSVLSPLPVHKGVSVEMTAELLRGGFFRASSCCVVFLRCRHWSCQWRAKAGWSWNALRQPAQWISSLECVTERLQLCLDCLWACSSLFVFVCFNVSIRVLCCDVCMCVCEWVWGGGVVSPEGSWLAYITEMWNGEVTAVCVCVCVSVCVTVKKLHSWWDFLPPVNHRV